MAPCRSRTECNSKRNAQYTFFVTRLCLAVHASGCAGGRHWLERAGIKPPPALPPAWGPEGQVGSPTAARAGTPMVKPPSAGGVGGSFAGEEDVSASRSLQDHFGRLEARFRRFWTLWEAF